MTDLRFDLGALADAQSRLRSLRTRFEGAERANEGVGAAAGHRRLGGVLGDFASAWNVHREDLSEQIGATADAAQAIGDTLRELDAKMAAKARMAR